MTKKIIAISVLLIMVIMCFSSCGLLNFANQVINSVSYQDEYLIEYQISNDNGTVTSISKGVDAQGNVYYRDENGEYLYIKNNIAYEEYKSQYGAFVSTENTYTQEKVEELTKGFNTYAEKSREKFTGKYVEGEKIEFQGKECTEYTLKLNIVFYTQTYKMLVEDETGVCLKYYGTSKVFFFETGKSGFECVKYETENLDFTEMLVK